MSTPSETIDLCKILSESRRITKSQAHHFHALSFLFLLPFCFSIVMIYPILLFKSKPESTIPTQILTNLLYMFFVTILSIFAVASISYSSFHAFHGTPVELITSIKSIFHSFVPLVSTLIIQELILALISFPFVYQAIQIYESESFDNSNYYFMAFIILMTLVFLVILIYLQVKWILVSVIVVVESKWGLEPMQRSAELVEGKEGLPCQLVLFFDFISLAGGFVWLSNVHRFTTWDILSMMTCACYLTTTVLLPSLATNVVLYVYYMEMHGQALPSSTVDELNSSLLK